MISWVLPYICRTIASIDHKYIFHRRRPETVQRASKQSTDIGQLVNNRACEGSESGEENEAERAENRLDSLELSGAVSGTPANWAKRWVGNFAAPLICSGRQALFSRFYLCPFSWADAAGCRPIDRPKCRHIRFKKHQCMTMLRQM